ncbi:MAG: HAMP domain-containing sensor histidine kinase, partial [Clostridia bacterium]|nr:HAMP domain-containing sensor histidine kinase [Clostridia bacterium]
MKKPTSIKTRITIWYTSLMFVLVLVVLSLVGGLSYQLSIDSVEKDVILQVTQVKERLSKRQPGAFEIVESKEEFKNVSIYEMDGKYIVGQYNYDVVNIPFEEGIPRRESIDGKDYIVYDTRTPGPPGMRGGFWIRGVESVNSTMLLGRSAIIIMLILIPLILLLTALGGYYITKKAFRPINNIVKTANEISAQNDIRQRIEINPESKEDELHNLSITLNHMLDKIENLIIQEKQFTSDASHELRTPISVILAQGEYLLDIAKDEKEKELAGTIVDKSKQVSKLVSRLLLLARIDQNRQKFNKEKVDLGVIIDVAIDSMKELAAQKEILLFSNVPEGTIVDADESLLLSAITNLISNGIKYGKESGHVSVSASKNGDKTEIIVADNGVGISEEHIDKIWTRFYRVDDVRNDEYGSSGLGLSMVKSIIELHGGEISVKSQLGKGTQFRVILN